MKGREEGGRSSGECASEQTTDQARYVGIARGGEHSSAAERVGESWQSRDGASREGCREGGGQGGTEAGREVI